MMNMYQMMGMSTKRNKVAFSSSILDYLLNFNRSLVQTESILLGEVISKNNIILEIIKEDTGEIKEEITNLETYKFLCLEQQSVHILASSLFVEDNARVTLKTLQFGFVDGYGDSHYVSANSKSYRKVQLKGIQKYFTVDLSEINNFEKAHQFIFNAINEMIKDKLIVLTNGIVNKGLKYQLKNVEASDIDTSKLVHYILGHKAV